MDTRFWGPAGWDLLHRISFHSKNPHALLENVAEILPCKFCRNSTRRFVKEFPYNKKPAEWLYNIHNKVNHKLRTQCANDPKVINPGPDPSFEEVKHKFQNKKLDSILGEKFLMSIAVNFVPTPKRIQIQKRFLHNLTEAYPLFKTFYHANPPDFSNYSEWMNKFTKISISEVESFKSKCKKGKTCRKPRGGGRRLTLRYKRKDLKKTTQTELLTNEDL